MGIESSNLLQAHELIILHSDESCKTDTNAEMRYMANSGTCTTRTTPAGSAWCLKHLQKADASLRFRKHRAFASGFSLYQEGDIEAILLFDPAMQNRRG